MDVKEFVSETLKQIIDGVKNAQKSTEGTGAAVNPFDNHYEKVEFDIAATVIESSETGGKAGLSVFSIGAGVTGKAESSSSVVSRIKFAILVRMPRG